MSRIDLRGARAIVTGASSGIGRQIAIQLAERGALLVATARRADRLGELVDAIGDKATVITVVGDITDDSVRAQCVAAACDQLGGIDFVINNAGVSVQGEFADGTPDQLRLLFEVNFFAAVELTRLAIPHLQESPRATVVNIASILGHRGIPFNSEYCATKFALRGWSEAVSAELAKLGIHVLVISPGTTDTEFFDNLIEKRRDMPWQQGGTTPKAVARATILAIQRRKRHIVPSTKGRLLLFANRVMPGVVNGIMRRLGRN